MFTATTFYRICITLVGAISVRGECLITPDENGRVVIPKDTDTIYGYAFKGCAALKTVVIPRSVKNIGYGAFYYAENLKKVIFQKGSRLEGIGESAFQDCFSLTRINFPASLKQIGAGAFYSSHSLRRINFPANLKDIGNQAFRYSGLKKIIFKNIEVIGDYVCYGCTQLKMVILPASVKEIGVSAFSCDWIYDECSLEKVIFRKGSELEIIYSQAFYGNENLKTINIPRGVVIEIFAFDNTGCPKDIFTPGAKIVDCIAKTKGLRGN